MRFVNIIRCLLSSLLIMSLAACAPINSRRGAAYLDDTVITGKVKAALMAAPGLRATELTVDTYEGTVQLSGFVVSPDDIPKAVALARRVNGVQTVKNDIALKR